MRDVRRSARLATDRVRSVPWLVGAGLVSILVTLGAFAGANVLVITRGSGDALGTGITFLKIAGLGLLFRTLLLSPVASAVYPAVSAADGGRSIRSAARTGLVGRTWTLVAGGTVTYAAGAVLAFVAFFALLAASGPLLTGLQAVGYTQGMGVRHLFELGGLATVVVFLGGCAVAAGVVGFAGPAGVTGVGFGPALRDGLRRLRVRPRRTVGHGVVVTGLFVAPFLVGIALTYAGPWVGLTDEWGTVFSLSGLLLSGALAYAVLPAYRVVATEGAEAAPDAAATDVADPVLDRRRVAVLGVVLALVLAGTVAVRVADVRPRENPSAPGYDADAAPGAAIETAVNGVVQVDRVTTTVLYERDPASSSRRIEGKQLRRYDPGQRQFDVYFFARSLDGESPAWTTRTGYLSEAVSMSLYDGPGGQSPPSVGAIRNSSSRWLVRPQLPVRYAPRSGDAGRWYFLDDVPRGTFRVVSSSPEQVVLETVDAAAYRRLRKYDRETIAGGFVRVTLDRETGYPTRIAEQRIRRDPSPDASYSNRTVSYSVTTIERQSVDVTRPSGAPPKGWLEVVFDAMVY